MERTNVAFLLVVGLSTVLGASVVAGFGSDLQDADTVSVVKDRLGTELVESSFEEESLVVSLQIHNPTGYDFRLTGSQFRAFNESDATIVRGAATRIDDGDDLLPARGTLTVRYQLSLSPSQERDLRRAIDAGDATLTGTHSFRLSDTQFSVVLEPMALSEDGGNA